VLVWLLAAATASHARAACGDYVTVGHSADADQAMGLEFQLSRLSAAGLTSDLVSDFGEHPRPLPGCHGPSCSRHLPLPLDPVPGSNSGGGEQWACFLVRGDISLRQPRLCELGLRIHLSEGHPLALERPPCV
jgi:hypothetical protein